MTDQSIEEIIDIIQQHINNADKAIENTPISKASEPERAYYRGLRLGLVIGQKEIIEKQLEELSHGRE